MLIGINIFFIMDISELSKINEWWSLGQVPKHLSPDRRRDLFRRIWPLMEKRQIISIVGLRRVGKSTIMYQIVEELIRNGVKPRNILYFTFDIKGETLEDILDTFRHELPGQDEGMKYIFLDEIQKLQDWADRIKVLYDLRNDLKFVISGSSGMEIEGQSGKVLAGRVFTNNLKPLSFGEFLRFSYDRQPVVIKNLNDAKEAMLHKASFLEDFLQYTYSGGFVEILGEEKHIRSMYVKSAVIDNMINRDLKDLEEIKDTTLVNELLKIIANNPGMIVNMESLGDDLGLSRQTMSKYLGALISAYSIKFLYSYSRNFLTSSKKGKKVYLAHPCIAEAFEGEMEEPVPGKMMENVLVYQLEGSFFFRKGNREIDIILRYRDKPIPVEVKYSKKIEERELKVIRSFVKKHDLELGIVATRDHFERRDRILLIPAFMIMLMEDPLVDLMRIFNEL